MHPSSTVSYYYFRSKTTQFLHLYLTVVVFSQAALVAGQCPGKLVPAPDGGGRGWSRSEDPKGANEHDDWRAAQ